MKKEMGLKIGKIIILSALCTFILIFMRALSGILGGSERNIFKEIIRVALYTMGILISMHFVAKRSNLKLASCYVSFSAIQWEYFILVLLLPVVLIGAITGFPGILKNNQITPQYAYTMLIPCMIDTGIGSALNEELIYRGYLLKVAEKDFGEKGAMLMISLIFGFLHLLNEPLKFVEGFLLVLYVTSIGVFLSMLTQYSQSIFYGILAHMLINVIPIFISDNLNLQFISFYRYTFSEELPFWITGGTNFPSIVATFVIWIFIFLLAVIKVARRKRTRAQ